VDVGTEKAVVCVLTTVPDTVGFGAVVVVVFVVSEVVAAGTAVDVV